jgi:hypothetical protein
VFGKEARMTKLRELSPGPVYNPVTPEPTKGKKLKARVYAPYTDGLVNYPSTDTENGPGKYSPSPPASPRLGAYSPRSSRNTDNWLILRATPTKNETYLNRGGVGKQVSSTKRTGPRTAFGSGTRSDREKVGILPSAMTNRVNSPCLVCKFG